MPVTATQRATNLRRRITVLKEIATKPGTVPGEKAAAEDAIQRLEALLANMEEGTRGWMDDGLGDSYYRLPERWYGSKCERNAYVPLTEINKMIRAEIKTLRNLGKKLVKQAAGTDIEVYGADGFAPIMEMPASIKVSVSKAKGGSSIYIKLTGVPTDWWEEHTDYDWATPRTYRKPVAKFQALVNALYGPHGAVPLRRLGRDGGLLRHQLLPPRRGRRPRRGELALPAQRLPLALVAPSGPAHRRPLPLIPRSIT